MSTFNDTLRTYMEDPHDIDSQNNILQHPNFTFERLVNEFLSDNNVFEGEGNHAEMILHELEDKFMPSLLIKMFTYNGKQEHIKQFFLYFDYEAELSKYLSKLT